MPPQFIVPPVARALCVRFPHVPITQVAERHGSGKMSLSKSGASGTRIWQCPWFFYPAFCDFLLGRTAVNPFGRPQLYRPDVFSPCYPWLYCQEASIEGEDLLGVDASLRAFYRRALVTAKYAPLELGNSLHINSQMLTIPNSQFVFIGQSPTNLAGFQQIFGIEIVGRATGGTFRLGIGDSSSAGTFLTPAVGAAAGGAGVSPTAALNTAKSNLAAAQNALNTATDLNRAVTQKAVTAAQGALATAQAAYDTAFPGAGDPTKYTPAIPFNAAPATVVAAVRAALGFVKPTTDPGAVTVSGPEAKVAAAGPWIVTINIPQVKTVFCESSLTHDPSSIKIYEGPPTSGPADKRFGVYKTPDDWWLGEGATELYTDSTTGETLRAQTAAHAQLFRLLWSGKFKEGALRFKITFEDGKVNYTNELSCGTGRTRDLFNCLYSGVTGNVTAPLGPGAANLTNTEKRADVVAARAGGRAGTSTIAWELYMSTPYDVAGVSVSGAAGSDPLKTTISDLADENPNKPIRFYIGFKKLATRVSNVEIMFTGVGAAGAGLTDAPSLQITKYDPYFANRLDQNVGKVVPTGEITVQRHQVVAVDMVYLLAVVGCVNMFTFQGFPPWTLLLSGIEAKQTRLPNGQPCFDMTFKFAFNPYTHQAIFRPLTMRWEFVRGVLISRIPTDVMIPRNPLSAINSRAVINPKAVEKAWHMPAVPRTIPLVVDPKGGDVAKGGAGAIAGGAVHAPPAEGKPPPLAPRRLTSPVPAGGGNPAGGADGGADGGAVLGAGTEPPPTNSNTNPVLNTILGVVSAVAGTVAGPFGTVPAENQEGSLLDLLAKLNVLVQDPNNPNYNPTDNWVNQSNNLGDMIAKSVGAPPKKNVADDDQKAAASGIEEDIKLGREQGAEWITSYDKGVSITETEGGTGNLEYDVALARAAHACGAQLAPRTREFLGLPPEDPAGGAGGTLGARLGFDPGSELTDPITAAGAPVNNAVKAVNVGAAKSVQQMSTRVYDVGLIYPICDFTPVLWMQ